MSQTHTDEDLDFIAQALPAFISEAREQIESIEQLLLQLEKSPGDSELLDALFRCAHTVKGSAGIFGLDKVVGFTHHVETLLDHLRDGSMDLTPVLSTLLLECNDQILHLVETATDEKADTPNDIEIRSDLITRLHSAMGESTVARAEDAVGSDRRWHISVHFGADCFRNGMDPLSILSYLGTLGSVEAIVCDLSSIPALADIDPESCHLGFELGLVTDANRATIEGAFSFVRDDCVLRIMEPQAPLEHLAGPTKPAELKHSMPLDGISPDAAAAAVAKQRGREPSPIDDNRYIRVQADRLDEVINLLGELVIASAGATLMSRQTRNETLIEANNQVGKLVEDIRNGTLQLRMVPIGETFSRFRRVVRDTAAELGKEVALEIVGGETELDKSVVERIADPLMHLVRNGLDHGLETPSQREEAGKPRQGRLVLSARHESGSILINITDDGRGIDRERVLARAWERGLVERGVTPPDADILKLIFEPGFSTAEKVTNLSGRGVGMDVVHRNIAALRGSVTVHSEAGAGSRIEIRLPLTLAIIDGFLVSVGPSKFIFPLDAVVEVIENQQTVAALDERGRGFVALRGQVLPIVSLRGLYGLESLEPERSSVVVMRAGGRSYGVIVDVLLGQHQTVIKPLGRLFRSLRGMSGSSILGSGEVALIFDVNSLSLLASEQPNYLSTASQDSGNTLRTAPISTQGIAS